MALREIMTKGTSFQFYSKRRLNYGQLVSLGDEKKENGKWTAMALLANHETIEILFDKKNNPEKNFAVVSSANSNGEFFIHEAVSIKAVEEATEAIEFLSRHNNSVR